MAARFEELVTRLQLSDYWKERGAPADCVLRDGKQMCR
jgi:hypothetical protein